MKKLPVLTCKNNHALISKAIPLLIASFLLASTFIITSPLLAQPATSRSSFGPHKNNKGYTFNLTHDSDLSKNQDGWCQPGSDSKTFNCTLNLTSRSSSLRMVTAAA